MSPQVRRIAILVTSLDAAAGRQLLLAMPSGLARDVRKAMASLTTVNPEEQRQVLAEFRNQAVSSSARSSSAGSSSAGSPAAAAVGTSPVKRSALGASEETGRYGAPAYAEHPLDLSTRQAVDTAEDEFACATGDAARPWAQLDVASLTDLLRGERPLVIAVVLSQLQPRHAARLLEQFPREQHRAVLANLTSLGDIDPEAMQAIDEHLASRIADYHHRRDSQSESVGRLQELLAAASPELLGHWQDIIADSDQQLAKRLGIATVTKPISAKSDASVEVLSPAAATARSGGRTDVRSSLLDMLASNVLTTADLPAEPHTESNTDNGPIVLPFPASPQASEPRNASAQAAATASRQRAAEEPAAAITTLDQILELPPRTIARVLSAADGEVVLLALAGATPSFMQRFTTMLEKPDARALQARLSGLGAINLQDVDEAQRRLCELASYIVAQMRSRRGAASTARVAA